MSSSLIEQLMQAIKAKDMEQAANLLNEHPDVARHKDSEGNSPILIAQYYGAKSIVTLLLDLHVSLNIHEAAAVGKLSAVVDLLEESPALMDSYSHDGYTPLGLAAFFGHSTIAAALLERGAKVNTVSYNTMRVTPLHSAAAGRHTSIAEVLLLHAADPNARQQSGWTPLHSAVHNQHIEMVTLLLKHGSDPEAANDEGVTPVDMARNSANVELLNLITTDLV